MTSVIAPEVDRQLKEGQLTLGSFLWSPSGRYLYFEGRTQSVSNLWRVAVDPRTLAWTHGPERLTTGPGRDVQLAISPDGAKLAFTVRAERTRLWSLPFDASTGTITGPSVAITEGITEEQSPDAPPDGSKFLDFAVRGASRELRQRTLPEGADRLLVAPADGWVPTKARWSRDGSRLDADPIARGSDRRERRARGGDRRDGRRPSPAPCSAMRTAGPQTGHPMAPCSSGRLAMAPRAAWHRVCCRLAPGRSSQQAS